MAVVQLANECFGTNVLQMCVLVQIYLCKQHAPDHELGVVWVLIGQREKKKGGGMFGCSGFNIPPSKKKKKKRTGKGDEITFTFYWKAKISGQPND